MKLIRESIYNFHKTGDVKKSLDIGAKSLIQEWIREMQIRRSLIDEDLIIDVNFSVDLDNRELYELPSYVKFGSILGYFDISENQLESLRGCPDKVHSFFACNNNRLKSLEGAPLYVKGDFACSRNLLESLDGAPKTVLGNFYCSDNIVKFTIEDVKRVCNVAGIIKV